MDGITQSREKAMEPIVVEAENVTAARVRKSFLTAPRCFKSGLSVKTNSLSVGLSATTRLPSMW
jgi:hypothetical protein